ncbi:MAG: preprotein translocase subunit SecG [Candidatus Omnitrophica bacterium]|nr:preprotein translocase subunit SecG [Candidatus Omnitrophota bacterium]
MIIVIVILHVIVCLFLILVILLQAGRGQGLSWGVFGGTPQSILGTRTASFLSRVTTACAVIFLFTCIALNIIETRKSRSLFAPAKPATQLDFAKIKEALEQAEQANKPTQTPQEQPKPVTASQEPTVVMPTSESQEPEDDKKATPKAEAP